MCVCVSCINQYVQWVGNIWLVVLDYHHYYFYYQQKRPTYANEPVALFHSRKKLLFKYFDFLLSAFLLSVSLSFFLSFFLFLFFRFISFVIWNARHFIYLFISLNLFWLAMAGELAPVRGNKTSYRPSPPSEIQTTRWMETKKKRNQIQQHPQQQNHHNNINSNL